MSKGQSIGTCKNCGSEIVELVNNGRFSNGECSACEELRYKSQAKLLAASHVAYGALCDLSYHRCFRWNRRRFIEANEAIDALAAAINESAGCE